jgi:oligopeptide/dipeptide ABC transporter ATP-binding protein
MDRILSVQDLTVEFATVRGHVRAVDELSFDIAAGETVAVVGESGSGKSTAALSILRLVPEPGRITAGSVLFDGRDIAGLDGRELRQLRGAAIGMIFQDPLVALNPLQTIGRQLAEVLLVHERLDARSARPRVVEALRLVGLSDAERLVDRHPHNLSGGMRQRAMIAMALLCRPRLLIADEPTTALDVTVQAQVLDLIREMKARLRMAVLLITHDFGVVAETADRVVVMYGGRKVEEGPVGQIFAQPAHPYTRALLRATRWDGAEAGYLPEMRAPSGAGPQRGCCFADRCDDAVGRCRTERPAWSALSFERGAACFLHDRRAA